MSSVRCSWQSHDPQSTNQHCTALSPSANYVRPSGFLCCVPDGLKITVDWGSWSDLSFLATFDALLRRYYLRNIRAFSELEMYAWYCAIGYRNFLSINRSIDRSIYLSIAVTECNAVLSSILATGNFFDPETTAFGGLKHLVSVFKMSRVLSSGSVKAIQKEIDMVCI